MNFDEFVLKNQILGFFEAPVSLKSGRKSCFYVNWRKATNDAYLLKETCQYILSFLEENKITLGALILILNRKQDWSLS